MENKNNVQYSFTINVQFARLQARTKKGALIYLVCDDKGNVFKLCTQEEIFEGQFFTIRFGVPDMLFCFIDDIAEA